MVNKTPITFTMNFQIIHLAKSWVPKNCTRTDFSPEPLFRPLHPAARDSSRTMAGHMACPVLANKIN